MIRPANFEAVKLMLATDESPLLGPTSRPGTRSPAAVNGQLDELFGKTGINGEPAQLIRSLVLLWHDHLDLSHRISQSIDSSDGSYVHGIMHRREPDFGNAAYWFRRVGDHPVYAGLAEKVAELNAKSHFTSRLIHDKKWNPLAMIDACEAADVGSTDAGDGDFLRKVQSIEFHLLLKRFCEL